MTKEEKIKLLELELAYLENASKHGIFLKNIKTQPDNNSDKKEEKKELCPC